MGKREDGLRARLTAWSLFVDNDSTFKQYQVNPTRDEISKVLGVALLSPYDRVYLGIHKEALYVSLWSYDKEKHGGNIVVDDDTTKYVVGRFTSDYNLALAGFKPLPTEIMKLVGGDKLVDVLIDMLNGTQTTPKVISMAEFRKAK